MSKRSPEQTQVETLYSILGATTPAEAMANARQMRDGIQAMAGDFPGCGSIWL